MADLGDSTRARGAGGMNRRKRHGGALPKRDHPEKRKEKAR